MTLNFVNKIVALGSASPIKYKSTTLGFPNSNVSKNNVKSGVDEQPFNTNTIEGVFGRLHNLKAGTSQINFYDLVTNTLHTLKAKVKPSHFYVAIESGIFTSDMQDNKIIPPIAKGKYFDHAIIGIMNGRGEIIVSASEGVEFPADCVEEAKRRGFDKFTAGMVMQEKGIITNHKDPHISLTGTYTVGTSKYTLDNLMKYLESNKNVKFKPNDDGKAREQLLLETIQKMQDNNPNFFK